MCNRALEDFAAADLLAIGVRGASPGSALDLVRCARLTLVHAHAPRQFRVRLEQILPVEFTSDSHVMEMRVFVAFAARRLVDEPVNGRPATAADVAYLSRAYALHAEFMLAVQHLSDRAIVRLCYATEAVVHERRHDMLGFVPLRVVDCA